MDEKKNPMQAIMINKLVLNIGTGSEEKHAEAAKRLLGLMTGMKPADELSKRRMPAFKITKSQVIGSFVTLRGPKTSELLKRLLDAVDNKIKDSGITPNSLSFGIKEYIDIRGIKYDPAIGILGMNVNVSFRRKGGRVSLRKRLASSIPRRHGIVDRELIKDYVKKEFNAEVV
jgi:large subunit ribosomal protein L5